MRERVTTPLYPSAFGRWALWEFPDDEAWDGLPGQIEYVNRRVLAAVSAVIATDPDAAVVLLSDHGSRRTPEDIQEHFHTFFAARTPGRDVFPDDPHPVNVLRLLAAAYLEEPLEPLPYRAWISSIAQRPLETEVLRDVP